MRLSALSLFALLPLFPLFAQTDLRGVVVETYGGVSGNGVQTVHLMVGKREYRLSYGKAVLIPELSSPRCREIGAIWSVRARIGKDEWGDLLRAQCDGSTQPEVYEPQRIVRAYLQHLFSFQHELAKALLTKEFALSGENRWRPQEKLLSLHARDLGLLIVKSDCFSVRPHAGSPLRTTVATIADCHLEADGERLSFSFDVVRPTATSSYRINAITVE
ncbi:MAG: hypothetical protein IPJ98_19580 [Bryobacterales bacterium]|nr:hypothetical protein [Bryobacterales bacterium]